KRVLQQSLPIADSCTTTNEVHGLVLYSITSRGQAASGALRGRATAAICNRQLPRSRRRPGPTQARQINIPVVLSEFRTITREGQKQDTPSTTASKLPLLGDRPTWPTRGERS